MKDSPIHGPACTEQDRKIANLTILLLLSGYGNQITQWSGLEESRFPPSIPDKGPAHDRPNGNGMSCVCDLLGKCLCWVPGSGVERPTTVLLLRGTSVMQGVSGTTAKDEATLNRAGGTLAELSGPRRHGRVKEE